MTHAVPRDLAPMLAKAVRTIPTQPGLLYEPKWDGFRCLLHRDGDDVELVSRSGKPLTRYFPEIVAAAPQLPTTIVLDGEIVVPVNDRLDWDALSARVHPAASRVALLAADTPATFVAFDVLALGNDSWLDLPLRERRAALVNHMGAIDHERWAYTNATTDAALATQWWERFEGAGLDGVVAKDLDAGYAPGKRSMLKIKHRRTADVVITGYRLHKNSTEEVPMVGSLQLSLYDEEGALVQIGGSSAFTTSVRRSLINELEPFVDGVLGGTTNRWTAGKDTQWTRLRPERVAEVAYDQLEGGRLRHTASFLRWRPDREAASCTFDQLDLPVRYSLSAVMRR